MAEPLALGCAPPAATGQGSARRMGQADQGPRACRRCAIVTVVVRYLRTAGRAVVQGLKYCDERRVQPAAVTVLCPAAAYDLVETRVDGEHVRRRAPPRALGHPQLLEIEDAPLCMQLGQEDAVAT